MVFTHSMTNTRQRNKQMAVLMADYGVYLKAEAKLKQSIIACRSMTLDGTPAWTYEAISAALGISRQAVHQYIKRWSSQ